MLLIHKPRNHKLLTRFIITSICSIGVLLGLSVLTYTPELSRAETVVLPEPKPDLSTITYMQDITQEICTNTNEADKNGNYQYQLTDKRDNQTYWVAKLKDGNCWMTQNLALDLDTAKPLTLADSNVSDTWTPPASTQQGTITQFPTTENDRTLSYNPGEYIYTTPMAQNSCGTSNISRLEGCPNWQLVEGLSKNQTHDERAHYLAGNYYSYEVATAGYSASTNVPYSICPKGWQLSARSGNASYDGLFTSYGTPNNLQYGSQDIRESPLYFVYGGGVFYNTIHSAGSSGFYWLSAASSTTTSFYLTFSSSIYPAYHYGANRYWALSVRCLALGGKLSGKENNVEVTINNTISLDVTNEVEVKKSEVNPSTAAFSALVASNQPYSVSISSANPNMTSSTSSTAIPSKSGTLTSNDNAWGIKLSTTSTYEQITTTPKLFYSSSNPESKSLPFTIGISTAPDIPNGEYSTNITITATQN